MRTYILAHKTDNSKASVYEKVEKLSKNKGKLLALPVALMEFVAPSISTLGSLVESIALIGLNLLGATIGAKRWSLKDAVASTGMVFAYSLVFPLTPLIGLIEGIRTLFAMLRDSIVYAQTQALKNRAHRDHTFLIMINSNRTHVPANPTISNPAVPAVLAPQNPASLPPPVPILPITT